MSNISKLILLILLVFIAYFIVDTQSMHEKTYKDLYGIEPYKNSIVNSCAVTINKNMLIASSCIKISKNEWHIRTCGSSHWCSIKIYNQKNIKLSNKKFCINETSVFLTKKIIQKYKKNQSIKRVFPCK